MPCLWRNPPPAAVPWDPTRRSQTHGGCAGLHGRQLLQACRLPLPAHCLGGGGGHCLRWLTACHHLPASWDFCATAAHPFTFSMPPFLPAGHRTGGTGGHGRLGPPPASPPLPPPHHQHVPGRGLNRHGGVGRHAKTCPPHTPPTASSLCCSADDMPACGASLPACRWPGHLHTHLPREHLTSTHAWH